jgi:hypothetical protein
MLSPPSDGCTGFQWAEWFFPATRACCEIHDAAGTDGALLDCLRDALPVWAYPIAAICVVVMIWWRPLYRLIKRTLLRQ